MSIHRIGAMFGWDRIAGTKLSCNSKICCCTLFLSTIDLDHQTTHSQSKLPFYYCSKQHPLSVQHFLDSRLQVLISLYIMSKLPSTASSVPPTTASPSANISAPAPMALPSMLPSSNTGLNTTSVDGTKAVVNPNQLQRTKMQNVPAFLNKLYKYVIDYGH